MSKVTWLGCVKFLANISLHIVVRGLRAPRLLVDYRWRGTETPHYNEWSEVGAKNYTHPLVVFSGIQLYIFQIQE